MVIETRFVGSCCDKNDTVLGKNCEELETLGQKKTKPLGCSECHELLWDSGR